MENEKLLILSAIACLCWAISAIFDKKDGKKSWIVEVFLAILFFILAITNFFNLYII